MTSGTLTLTGTGRYARSELLAPAHTLLVATLAFAGEPANFPRFRRWLTDHSDHGELTEWLAAMQPHHLAQLAWAMHEGRPS